MTQKTPYAGYNLAAVEATVGNVTRTTSKPEIKLSNTSIPCGNVGYNLADVEYKIKGNSTQR